VRASGRCQQVDATRISDPAVDTVLSDLVGDVGGGLNVLMLAGSGAVSVRAAAEEIAAPAAGAGAPHGLDAALLPDGRVLAAWATAGQGAAFSLRETPTR
jgi:hypothetical protein